MTDFAAGQTAKPEPPPITTAALLARLSAGLTTRDLKNERDRRFLPPLEDGLWSAKAVRRAKRLYRLRRLGADGDTLRLLLFLADGWGWEDIKDTCLKGLERILALSLIGVAKYETAKGPLDFYVEDIAEMQHKTLLRKVPDTTMGPTSTETTGFAVGLLRDGVPLEGGSANRIAVPLAKAAWPGIDDSTASMLASFFGLFSTLLDLRAARLVERLTSASPEQVEQGRISTLQNVRCIRVLIRNLAGKEANGRMNILTGFGYAREMISVDFSSGDIRLSPKFMLGGLIGQFIAFDISLSEFVQGWLPLAGTLTRMFSATGNMMEPHGEHPTS